MDVITLTKQALIFKTLLGIISVSYFTVQPWNHQTADALWVSLSLISLVYVCVKKAQNYNFEIPAQLKTVFWLFTLMPLVSIISYLATPLDTLTLDLLEADTRWLLVIPIIITLRDKGIGPYWILAMLGAYAISIFISSTIETEYFSNLKMRARGDENAVSYGLFNATVSLMLLSYFVSRFINNPAKHKYTKTLRLSIFILFILACTATFLSGSRAAIVSIPIGVFVIYSMNYSKIKATLGIVLLISIGLIITTALPNSAFVRKLTTTPDRVSSYFMVHDQTSRSHNQRLEQWAESWCIFKIHPITGTGPRTFKHAHQVYGDTNHCDSLQQLKQGSYQAHSLYFNTIATLGTLGIITLILFFGYLLNLSMTLHKNKECHQYVRLGTSLLIIALVSHLINGITLDLIFRNHIIDKFLIVIALPIILIFQKRLQIKDA